jgi:tagatose kinase
MAEILMAGEALVEMMRVERDRPLDRPALFGGPYPSGAPAIAASCAARLGASVGFVGAVGQDPFGDCIRQRLGDDGIDLTALAVHADLLTAIAFVAYRSDGSRSFVFHLPQSAAAQVSMAQIPSGYLHGVRYLHIMGSSLSASPALRETCCALADAVHADGGVISLDPNLRPELLPVERIRAVCEPILARARVVMPSGEELTGLTGAATPEEGARGLLERGVEIVALKRGAAGSTLYTAEGVLEIPPYRVEEVDPTGAGDCYDAALLVGLSEGWGLAKAGLFANAVGALATTRLGPMEGAFSREHVLRFMAEQGQPLP